MDSNFRVNITTDISALQDGLKKVQAELDKFKKTADGAAAATKNMEQNANRGRMVAFAFGQVVRDAGFFANNFSLGILAISNNIPILIDQISLSVKALQPFAGALSLVGSLLTAGLTIWAYSSQAVKENKQSIEQWRNSLDDATESTLRGTQASAQEIAKLDLLYKASVNTANSTQTRISAAKQLQDLYPSVFQNYSTEEIMLGKVEGGYNKLKDSILEAAKAQAAFDKIVENSNRILDNNARAKEIQAELNTIAAQTTKTLTDRANEINSTYGENQKSFRTTASDLASLISKTLEANPAYRALRSELQNINTDTKILNGRNKDLENTLDSNKDSVDALIQSWAGYNEEVEKSKRIQLPSDAFVRLPQKRPIYTPPKGKEVKRVDLVKPKVAPGSLEAEQLKEMVLNLIELEKQIDDVLVNGIANTIGDAMMAIGEAFATGGDIGKSFGNALLSSLASVLSRFGDMLIAASLAGLQFSKAFKNLFNEKNWALALAAGVALKITAGALSGFTKNVSGGGSGANVASAASGMGGGLDNRGMGPIYTRSTISNIGLSSQANPVLETRVSGNDLVILMKRADKNRNGYY